MKASPTSRSLKHLRNQGYLAEKVEQRLPIPGKFVTRDLFNFIDIVAVHPELKLIIGVQATSGSNMAKRRSKIDAEPRARAWKLAGGFIRLHGWAKKGARGERKLWTLREEEL